MVKGNVELVMSQFFDTGMEPVNPSYVEREEQAQIEHDDEVVKSILNLIEERIRPFVQQDGGDIDFVGFDKESGVVSLKMKGACAGCPKSAVTLKFGIQRMMMHYIPEVKNVINIEPEAPSGE